jgi:hypothetical protein
LCLNFSRFPSALFFLKQLHDTSFNRTTELSRWRLFLKSPGGKNKQIEQTGCATLGEP